MREEVAKQGVVYTTIEDALHDPRGNPSCAYFGTLIPHRPQVCRASLRRMERRLLRVRSRGRHARLPPASYFRLNAQGAASSSTRSSSWSRANLHFIEGCSAPKYYEPTSTPAVELFVKDGARLRYSTIENWSKNMYNLNTKRATVGTDSEMEWVSVLRQPCSYLYPTTILAGTVAAASSRASPSQVPRRTSTPAARSSQRSRHHASVNTKSISKDGGVNTFRSSRGGSPCRPRAAP